MRKALAVLVARVVPSHGSGSVALVDEDITFHHSWQAQRERDAA